MKFNFNKTANFDEENLDNIWVVDMWLDNMDSKDGHDHIEFTKIGLIDFLNNEIKDYNSTNGADYTVLDRNATNKEVKEVLYDLLEGKVAEIKPYNEKTANKKCAAVTKQIGRWLLKLVKAGETTNRGNGEFINKGKGDEYDIVEIYDTKAEPGKFTEYGQFVSDYYVSTFLKHNGGLSMVGYVPAWTMSAAEVKEAQEWLKSLYSNGTPKDFLEETMAEFRKKNKTAKKQIKAEKEPKTKIDVLFKLEKPEGIDGLDVVAWFLSDPDTCYSHNGQHSNCYPNYMASLEDAKFTDYEYLLKELENIGYEVNVMNGDYKQQKKASRKFTFNKKEAGEEIDKVNLDFMKDTEDTSYALKLLRDGIVTRESRHFDQLVENILNDGEGSAAPLTLLLLGILDENDRYYHNAVKQCLPHPTYAADLLERGIITKDSEYYIDAVNSAIRYEDIAKRLVEKGIIDEKYVQHDAERRKEQLRSALSESILTLRENGKPFYDLRLVWQNKNEPIQHLKQALDEAASRLDKIGLKEDADYYRGLLKQASKKVKASAKALGYTKTKDGFVVKVMDKDKDIKADITIKVNGNDLSFDSNYQFSNDDDTTFEDFTDTAVWYLVDKGLIKFDGNNKWHNGKSASIKRKAGTGNFSTQEGYPLIAIGDEQVYPQEAFVDEWNEENPDEPISEWDEQDNTYYSWLDQYYDATKAEMEHYLKNADIPEGWNITLEPGYYEGVQLWVEEPTDFEYYFEQGWLDDKELGYDELTPEQKAELQNAMQAQYEKEKAQVAQIMIDAAKACGWLQLKVDWRASNGETGYSIVKSKLSKKAEEDNYVSPFVMDNIAEKFGLSSAWVTDLEKNGKHYDAYSIYKKDKSGYTLSNSYTQENAQLVLDELKKQYPNIEAQLTYRQYKYAPEMKKEVLLVVQTDVDYD